MSLELGNVFSERNAMSLSDGLVGRSLWAGVRTPIGPVYAGIGRAGNGDTAFYVSLGRVF